jgi:hypothetical protein
MKVISILNGTRILYFFVRFYQTFLSWKDVLSSIVIHFVEIYRLSVGQKASRYSPPPPSEILILLITLLEENWISNNAIYPSVKANYILAMYFLRSLVQFLVVEVSD